MCNHHTPLLPIGLLERWGYDVVVALAKNLAPNKTEWWALSRVGAFRSHRFDDENDLARMVRISFREVD